MAQIRVKSCCCMLSSSYEGQKIYIKHSWREITLTWVPGVHSKHEKPFEDAFYLVLEWIEKLRKN